MTTVRRGVRRVVDDAGPGFTLASLASAVAVLWYAGYAAPAVRARYVHLVLGLLWTGGNLVFGVVVGPVLSSLDDRRAGAFYARAAPRFAVLFSAMLVVVIAVGVPLSVRMRLFDHPRPWVALVGFAAGTGILLAFARRFDAWGDRRLQAAFGVVAVASAGAFAATASEFGPLSTSMLLTLAVGTLITVVGLGAILANDVRATFEARAARPDYARVAALGRRNALLARVQILLQLFIVISVL